MLYVRRAHERGAVDMGWLDSRHTFSFGSYYDPNHMGYGNLRVINEDRVQPGKGFDTHGHRDMEIISYVIDGALAHEDSMGNGSTIRPGDVQRMTAGTGVTHSEFNASDESLVHFLQIWVIPERQGLPPGYEQKHYSPEDKTDRLRLVASRDGRDGSLTIHQDVDLYASLLGKGSELVHPLVAGRRAWLQVVRGRVALGEETLEAGDGAAAAELDELVIRAEADAEILLFDMA